MGIGHVRDAVHAVLAEMMGYLQLELGELVNIGELGGEALATPFVEDHGRF